MNIDRSALERELASVRQQQQQFVRLVEQSVGAEKAIVGLLSLLDKMEPRSRPGRPSPMQAEADALRANLGERPDDAVKAAIEGMTVTDPDEEVEPTDYDVAYSVEALARLGQNINGAAQ